MSSASCSGVPPYSPTIDEPTSSGPPSPMPSLFSRKKSPTATVAKATPAAAGSVSNSDTSESGGVPIPPQQKQSPLQAERSKPGGHLSRDRVVKEKNKRPRSLRTSKSFTRNADARDNLDEHPLNFHPDDPRRLSALSAMSNSPARENGMSDEGTMETTPAPEPQSPPGSFPQPNGSGVNGVEHEDAEVGEGPQVPPHRTPPSPPPSRQQDEQSAPQDTPEKVDTPRHEEQSKVDAEACKAAGNKFYKAGKYALAIDEYNKAIDADPASSTFLSNRAAAYMANNQYVAALEDCKMAGELEPNNSKILHRLAKVYIALGRPQDALDVYNQMEPPATAKDKKAAQDMQTHISQAQDSLATGTSGSMVLHALDQAEKGLGKYVQPPRKWKLMRGEAQLKMGNVNSIGDAQSVAMSLLRSNSADPEALVLRGRALYGLGENEKAIQHFRQALSCDPDFKDAVKYLRMVQKLDRMKEEGNSHFKAGRYPAALEVYTTALGVDPLNKGTNSKILNNRAMCHTRLKQHTQAIEDCDQAIKLDPSYTKARKTRAKAFGESGDWDEAVRSYKSIAEQSPEEPGIAKDIRAAELELKKSKRKDYYKVLGVEKDANEYEIKRAYKKLAVIHHPDKNIDDPKAEERFKEIQEAHETLTDPQKRERYDSGVDLMEPGEGMGGFPGGFGGGGGGVQIDPEMLFNMMGGGGGPGGGGGGGFRFASGAGGSPFGGMGGGQRGFPPGFG